jgi:hypothetical protein
MKKADFLLATKQVLFNRRGALRRSLDGDLALLSRREGETP